MVKPSVDFNTNPNKWTDLESVESPSMMKILGPFFQALAYTLICITIIFINELYFKRIVKFFKKIAKLMKEMVYNCTIQCAKSHKSNKILSIRVWMAFISLLCGIVISVNLFMGSDGQLLEFGR